MVSFAFRALSPIVTGVKSLVLVKGTAAESAAADIRKIKKNIIFMGQSSFEFIFTSFYGFRRKQISPTRIMIAIFLLNTPHRSISEQTVCIFQHCCFHQHAVPSTRKAELHARQ